MMIRCNDDNGTKRKCDTIGHLWERNESWIVKKISSFYFFCVNYNLLDFKESKLTKVWDPSTRHWCEMRTRLKTSHRAKAQQSERWLLAVFWLISWRMKKASFLLTHSRVHCVYKRKKKHAKALFSNQFKIVRHRIQFRNGKNYDASFYNVWMLFLIRRDWSKCENY